MHVVIHDEINGLLVQFGAEGAYAPDVMADLRTRCLETYQKAMVERYVVGRMAAKDAGSE